jgi:hypothetical protein
VSAGCQIPDTGRNLGDGICGEFAGTDSVCGNAGSGDAAGRNRTNRARHIPAKNILNVLKKPPGYWYGDITDPEFLKQFLVRKWDCALVVRSETYDINRRYLDLIWGQMSLGGVMLVDRIKNQEMKSAYEDFCKVVHRPVSILNSRYGAGLVIR